MTVPVEGETIGMVYFGLGIEGVTALDACGNWKPGFGGMDLGKTRTRR